MSDTLHAWMQKWLVGIKGGWSHEHLLELCAIDQQTYEDAKKSNDAFKNALALAEAGIGATELTVPEFMRLLRSQVGDERIAGYFGLTIEELKEQIVASPELTRAYQTGRLKGQAELQMTQHVVALTGDVPMLTFLGKQYLDQQDKKTLELTTGKLDEMIRQLEAKLGQSEVKRIQGGIIDAEAIEIAEDAENSDD